MWNSYADSSPIVIYMTIHLPSILIAGVRTCRLQKLYFPDIVMQLPIKLMKNEGIPKSIQFAATERYYKLDLAVFTDYSVPVSREVYRKVV